MRRVFGFGSLCAATYCMSQPQVYNSAPVMKMLNAFNFHTTALCQQREAGERPYLGASIRSNIEKPGMSILLVHSESPAAKAGLKPGDVILSINGQEVNNIKDYNQILADLTGSVRFTIIRYEENKEVEVVFQ